MHGPALSFEEPEPWAKEGEPLPPPPTAEQQAEY